MIVSDRLWRTSLNADPAVIGQSITIDGLPRTVVGVLPPDFRFKPVIRNGTLPEADIFLPNRWPGDTGTNAFLFLLGRMKSGVTQESAEAELTALVNDSGIVPAGALTQAGAFAPNVRTLARVVGLQKYGTESTRTLLLILLGAVSFVQLIACINVANLQMARLSARRGELSVRMALGAGRRRIVRQLLTEGVVLSLLGTTLAVLLAQVAIDVTLPLVPQAVLPRLGGIVIDARVMAFCLGLSVVSALLIGLVPALRVGGAAFGEGLALHSGDARTTGDRQGERLRTLLVAAQIAMTLAQRRREIGVRMALGAERGDVLRLVLIRALRIVGVGLIVGLAGAAVVTRVLQRFLFGVTPTDPIVFALVTLLLMAVGLLAAWLPARRAANVDPVVALRCE